jgi:hypothetical protein
VGRVPALSRKRNPLRVTTIVFRQGLTTAQGFCWWKILGSIRSIGGSKHA